MAEEKATVDGKYFTFLDKPFVRENNMICYGDMTDDYVLFLMILTTKKVGDTELPDQILVQVVSTDQSKNPMERVAKQFTKSGLYEAMEIGLIWLDKLNGNEN